MGGKMSRFNESIVDWKEFELFVKSLYEGEEKVSVEHDVTLVGKSGAKRQIDVLIKQKSSLHEYITLVECKRWKEKVTRSIVDIMFAAIDDLNASKGVIFTTTGYEAGAEEYAKSKNIDIFVVREMTNEEWGLPGRIIHLYMHFISGHSDNITMSDAKLTPIVENYPKSFSIPKIELKKDMEHNIELDLYSIKTGDQKGNFTDVLLKYQEEILHEVSEGMDNTILGKEKSNMIINIPIELDFTGTEFRQLRFKFGAVEVNKVEANLKMFISQSIFHSDRAEDLDYALMVENYVNRQMIIASKKNDESHTKLSENLYDKFVKETILDKNQVLENNSILKVYAEPYVKYEIIGNEIIGQVGKITKEVSI
jgi:hypothetical protein